MVCKVEIPGVALLLLLLASTTSAQDGVFDITKYNPKPDIAEAVMAAWKEACASATPSKVVIPAGDHQLGEVLMEGPCKAAIELQVDGVLKSPAEVTRWIKFNAIDQFTISGKGTFDGQGQTLWENTKCAQDHNCKSFDPSISFNKITNALIQDVTSKDSKSFHVNVLNCKNITFKNFNIDAPAESPNTDGIHIGRSNGVNIIDSKIGTGDDCISIGDGSEQVTISGVTCGPGHGISIGSLGRYDNEQPVVGIFVKKATLTNTDNGVRIKSWPALKGGEASDIHFEDITMENVTNPVIIDQMYCPWNQCSKEGPSKVKISNVSFKNIKGTTPTAVAVAITCSSSLPCEQVELADIDLKYTGTEGPASSNCTNAKITVTGKLNPPGC